MFDPLFEEVCNAMSHTLSKLELWSVDLEKTMESERFVATLKVEEGNEEEYGEIVIEVRPKIEQSLYWKAVRERGELKFKWHTEYNNDAIIYYALDHFNELITLLKDLIAEARKEKRRLERLKKIKNITSDSNLSAVTTQHH